MDNLSFLAQMTPTQDSLDNLKDNKKSDNKVMLKTSVLNYIVLHGKQSPPRPVCCLLLILGIFICKYFISQ